MALLDNPETPWEQVKGLEEWKLNSILLSESELGLVKAEIQRIAGQPQGEPGSVRISDECLVSIFKLVAFVVDSK